MIYYIEKISNYWEENGFEIIIGLCLAFFLILFLYRKIVGKKGTWSDSYYYTPTKKEIIKRKPPTESKGEMECRRVLQKIFNRPFRKERPDFLRNPVTGGNFNLELDCFDSNLGLAVEYQGVQHYEFNPFFHKSKDAFLNQKYRDFMKRKMCEENGIILIEVPYSTKNIETYLKNELNKNGFNIY